MVGDAQARNAVRQLMHRFDAINFQRLGVAYVLAAKTAMSMRDCWQQAQGVTTGAPTTTAAAQRAKADPSPPFANDATGFGMTSEPVRGRPAAG